MLQNLQQSNRIIMTYRASLQIVISLTELYLFTLKKQGQIRFKLNLYQTTLIQKQKNQSKLQPKIKLCNPYNILRGEEIKQKKRQPNQLNQYNNLYGMQTNQKIDKFPIQKKKFKQESTIDYEGESYYSKIIQTKYSQQIHEIEQSIFFKCYIPVDQLDKTQLMIKVQLLFSPDNQNMFKVLGIFNAKIRKLSPISSFLPITFDQFQGFTITATYHTTIMQFKFQQNTQQTQIQSKEEIFNSFQDYMSAVTNKFRRNQTRHFYQYYRQYLQKQLFQVQQRHSDLIRVLNIQRQFGFYKVSKNFQLSSLINELPSNQKLYLDLHLEQTVINEILKDFLSLKALIYQKWNQLIIFMTEFSKQTTQFYKCKYDQNLRERFKTHVFSHKIQGKHDWTFSKYQDSGKQYLLQAEQDKKKVKDQQLWSEHFPIQNIEFFNDQKKYIKIFEQIFPICRNKAVILSAKKSIQKQGIKNTSLYNKSQKKQIYSNDQVQRPSLTNIRKSSMSTLGEEIFLPKNFSNLNMSQRGQKTQGLRTNNLLFQKDTQLQKMINKNKNQHIIVLVHGYQASRQDFLVLKNCLQIRFKCKVFISSSNEGRTEDNIEAMGKRLAIQLSKYFQHIDFDQSTRISFLGHSLGGVIIRSALGFLNNINDYLYSYLSFSSPHLGYLYEPSKLVQAGLWFINTWQGSKCLNQLCMKDSQDLRQTYLYRLCQNGALNNFKKIALICSTQDEYIPYESARIQKNSDILFNKINDSISRNVIIQMVDNIIGEVNAQEISRLNVIFNIQDRNMDSMIGRTAHVKYLSDQKFIKMFCIVFQKFFV